MITEDMSNNQTKVNGVLGRISLSFFNLMGLFMDMEKSSGRDLEVGLQNLKIFRK